MTDKERYLLHTNQRLSMLVKAIQAVVSEMRKTTSEISSLSQAGCQPSPEFLERYNDEVVPLMESFQSIKL
ncbi:hypothetical protein A8C56_02960 [Niabella ginsenosidivorans]|uniref:Uncharacterized protein n=1 Tax=Niabella ginsenosidivorans TaxID=1176587 RepID=A0A1A9I031_9BACT|nr:hypothetical protein [Niabella ginsenosidivorans]ANH80081.1 hypothetical protein A8C56_02960 [Niabella ginsenosidivorans]